jgi:hypothetical protein
MNNFRGRIPMKFRIHVICIVFSFYVCFFNFKLSTTSTIAVVDVEQDRLTYFVEKPFTQFNPQVTSTDCRIAWDTKKKESLINFWLTLAAPILIGPIRHRELSIFQRETLTDASVSSDDIVYVIFTQAHLTQNDLLDFNSIEWMCSFDKGSVLQKAVFAPRNKNRRREHVILICNSTAIVQSTNQADSDPPSSKVLNGIFPTRLSIPVPDSPGPIDVNTTINNSTMLLYDLQDPLHCDYLEQLEQSLHNNVHHTNSEKAKVGACLRFRGEYDRALVPEWIEYHRLLGFQHFWVYINERWDVTGLYNYSDITYVPFDLYWPDHASYFALPYRNSQPKLSQEPASWHCLYTAKKYGYDWIVTTDVDEYIYVPKNISDATLDPPSPPVSSTLESIIGSPFNVASSSPIHSYLSRFSPKQYSSLIMNSIPFGSNIFLNDSQTHTNLSESMVLSSSGLTKAFKQPLMIDYVWRKKQALSDYKFQRYKQFYNPQTVWSIGVHYCWFASGIGIMNRYLNPHNDGIFLAHYKLSNQGVSRRGSNMMVKSLEDLQQDRSLHDDYRNELVRRLRSTKLISNGHFPDK